MQMSESKYFRRLLCPALFIFAFLLLHDSFRFTALVLLIGLAISYVHFLRSSRTALMRLMFVTFLIAVFLPIDVSLQNSPGPPRFVPLVMGSPTEQDVARAENNEVMLGGCILRGNAPRWVWVW